MPVLVVSSCVLSIPPFPSPMLLPVNKKGIHAGKVVKLYLVVLVQQVNAAFGACIGVCYLIHVIGCNGTLEMLLLEVRLESTAVTSVILSSTFNAHAQPCAACQEV